MNIPPQPVIFRPIYKPKPWGGRELERLFGRKLPSGEPIGESWEISGLAGDVSVVREGPAAGITLHDLMQAWGGDLLGSLWRPADESVDATARFPLLIKFLDARERLSVQVHPKSGSPDVAGGAAVKHEAWFVVAAEPESVMYVGLQKGVTESDIAAAADSARIAELLQPRPARPGACYYLPSGTPHALGAGVVVAEVQTPSDVTYRLYDWGRVDHEGRPRTLHIEQALRNLRTDVDEAEIVQPRRHSAGPFVTTSQLITCESFLLSRVRMAAGLAAPLPHAEMVIWVVLRGRGRLVTGERVERPFEVGETVLLPARSESSRVEVAEDCDLLEIAVPIRSAYPPGARPVRDEAPPGAGEPVRLTVSGRHGG